MGIVHNPDSEYMKEMRRWDTPKRLGGMAPDGYEPFPRMVYKAFIHPQYQGKVMCGDPRAATGLYGNAQDVAIAESFNRQCQRIVNSPDELDRAMQEGWRSSPVEAMEHYDALQKEIARAAAEEAHRLQRMSAKARAEHKAADDESDEHIVEVPVPKKAPRMTRVSPATE